MVLPKRPSHLSRRGGQTARCFVLKVAWLLTLQNRVHSFLSFNTRRYLRNMGWSRHQKALTSRAQKLGQLFRSGANTSLLRSQRRRHHWGSQNSFRFTTAESPWLRSKDIIEVLLRWREIWINTSGSRLDARNLRAQENWTHISSASSLAGLGRTCRKQS